MPGEVDVRQVAGSALGQYFSLLPALPNLLPLQLHSLHQCLFWSACSTCSLGCFFSYLASLVVVHPPDADSTFVQKGQPTHLQNTEAFPPEHNPVHSSSLVQLWQQALN